MDVEHLWFSSKPMADLTRGGGTNSLVAGGPEAADTNMVQALADMADKRLYKLVKWCKSLPLFKNILVRIIFLKSTVQAYVFNLIFFAD